VCTMSDEEGEGSETVTEMVVADFPNLSPEQAFSQERDLIEELRSRRPSDGQSDLRFSVAFSGGGIRAAAFQAGVLWRLAQENKLKDVEYLAAVSGGSYIASAFASHVAAAEEPSPGEVHKWYLDVVSKTLRRMQLNAGDFVRDCVSHPCYTDEYSGPFPRVFDLPILLVVLAFTLVVHPFVFTVCFLVPMMIFVQMYFGAAMRAVFCAPPTDDWLTTFRVFSHIDRWAIAFAAVLLLTSLVAVLRRVLPACRLRRVEGRRRRHATVGFLIGHSLYHLLKRIAWFIIILTIFLVFIPLEQSFTYDAEEARHYCSQYIKQQRAAGASECWDLHEGALWYDDVGFKNITSGHFPDDGHLEAEPERRYMTNALAWLSMLLAVVLLVAICFMPIIGSELFSNTIGLAGPLLLLSWAFTAVQYVVFGPLTGNSRGNFGEYEETRVNRGVSWSLKVALVVLPFYDDLRAGLHMYYRRCLKLNFFADGKDLPIRELGDHPLCPFVVLTGTSNDYQPPDDTDKISELSFSCLHFGGEETGYVETPAYRTLAKCTAISGAGCLDAISLSMSDALSLRFWLEVLNLSWGDYVSFREVCASPPESAGLLQDLASRLLHRVPSFICWIVAFWFLHSVWDDSCGKGRDCLKAKRELDIVGYIFGAMLGLSFFAFTSPGQFMAMSPLLRQIHQVTKYYFVGNHPPPKLYMTDGGVKDCTAIVQLLWRRRERILLVLAAADPNDELNVLRTAMGVATELKLASFYDPRDPRRSVDVVFERFKGDLEQRTLHIGISYCFDDQPSTGHLIIVKNRLPPSLVSTVRPKLRHRDITMATELSDDDSDFEDEEDDEEAFGDMRTNELGPFGCCDCCHVKKLNCGPKFPHGSFTGYLYLSPHWCSSHMRLGYDISSEAIALISSAKPLQSNWEQNVEA